MVGAFCGLAAAAEPPEFPRPADLAFRDFYRLPVGPRGLEPNARLLALDGQRVRITGYMAALADAPPGLLILSAVPVRLGDEDESFADDLPPAAVYVHLVDTDVVVPLHRQLLTLTGRLQIGPLAEADGRLSFVRLILEAESSAALTRSRP